MKVNENGRDFVVGDLHGSYSCLKTALEGVQFNYNVDRLFSVGDLIDRGPESEKCLSLLKEPWFFSVIGNHENLMTEYYRGGPYGMYWKSNGGSWGLENNVWQNLIHDVENLPLLRTVSLKNGKKFHIIHAELFSVEPLTDDDLLGSLAFEKAATYQSADGDFITWGRYLFGSLYNKPLNERNIHSYLHEVEVSNRGKFFNPGLSHIYSGHTICRNPVRFMEQTNLDTGAFLSYRNGYEWAGLTITEPLTDRFWKATGNSFEEIGVLILK